MAHVHAQRDLGLLAIPTEMPLADQDADNQAPLYVAQLRLVRTGHARKCFTVKKNVKRPRGPQSASGVITRYRSGSLPSLCVSTPPRSRRYSCTMRRSNGGSGASSTGFPELKASWAA